MDPPPMTCSSIPFRLRRAPIALVLISFAVVLAALWVQIPASATAAEPHSFIHPGGVIGQAELDVVKAKLAAGEEPWTSALGKLQRLFPNDGIL